MSDDKRWPDFEDALARVWPEMPKEAASMGQKGREIRPMGGWERFWRPEAVASTDESGNILYNRERAKLLGISPEDLMVHELTHVGQQDREGGLFTQIWNRLMSSPRANDQAYYEDPREKEAFAKEKSRAGKRRRTTDIRLK